MIQSAKITNPHQAMSMTPAQIAMMYNQTYASQAMNNLMANTQIRHMWMWNGISMSLEDFAEHAYGDTPERSHFILKYKDLA